MVLTIPQYSSELNQIEHTFDILKVRIIKNKIFNIKDFKEIIR